MRTTVLISAGILFLGLGAGIVMQMGESDAQAVPILNNCTITWDPVTRDVQGNPETIRDVELALWPSGASTHTTPIGWMSNLPPTAPVGGIPIQSLFQGKTSGTYQIAARAYDTAGNASTWSPPLTGIWDTIAPMAPGNLRIVVTVQIQVNP